MMQEQQRAADERQRLFMAAIQDRRAHQTPAVTRSTVERAVINQYGRLESVKSAAGSRAMLSARGHRPNDKP